MYEMKDEYRTGVKFIDEQHEKIFDIADRTYMLLKNDLTIDKYDKVVELMDELREYTKFHFKEEEAYMDKIGFKRMFTQKVEHAEFIKKLDDMDLSTIDENQDQYIMNILQFLSDWLVEHILEKDMLIGKQE
ncbi:MULTISPECIES: hemerythrin family protein [Clostridium]|uniref:Hemerythrin family protein n=1 Tax=Clostridium cibarium TaxID=2762247 RepID=A0ABR8PUJ2_9CLOT|nr:MULTISPECIES: hemerythrin family protein [Clostridium]MBD7911846.1 hemerythrin family protein [Clostridium cibarium]